MTRCGSGSGSADPCPWLIDQDTDPAILVNDLQDANKKQIFKNKFFCLLLYEGTFTSFFKDKKSKRSHETVRIKVFLTIFADPDPGGPKTCGSGVSGSGGSGSGTRLPSSSDRSSLYPSLSLCSIVECRIIVDGSPPPPMSSLYILPYSTFSVISIVLLISPLPPFLVPSLCFLILFLSFLFHLLFNI